MQDSKDPTASLVWFRFSYWCFSALVQERQALLLDNPLHKLYCNNRNQTGFSTAKLPWLEALTASLPGCAVTPALPIRCWPASQLWPPAHSHSAPASTHFLLIVTLPYTIFMSERCWGARQWGSVGAQLWHTQQLSQELQGKGMNQKQSSSLTDIISFQVQILWLRLQRKLF